MPTFSPRHRLNSGPFGTMGVGLPFGIGAKVACPDKQVIVVHGDGSFGMNAMEIDTAVRHKIPILIVISLNGGWTGDPKREKPGRDLGYTRFDKMCRGARRPRRARHQAGRHPPGVGAWPEEGGRGDGGTGQRANRLPRTLRRRGVLRLLDLIDKRDQANNCSPGRGAPRLMHVATSPAFKANAHRAIADVGLQKALARSGPSFIARRTAAVAALPEFERCATLRATSRTTRSPISTSTWRNGKPSCSPRADTCTGVRPPMKRARQCWISAARPMRAPSPRASR